MFTTVHVSNIASETSDKEVRDFFSFCGKITHLSVTPTSGELGATKSATITFEWDAAAKTALLLDQTKLGPNPVGVSSAHSIDEIAQGHVASHADEPTFGADDEVRQETKPRSAIFAEMLAGGYALGDNVLTAGIELDKKHGISAKFTSALKTLDSKLHASDRAKAADQSYHLTDKVGQGKTVVLRYFERALGTPTGKKIRSFYESTEKQVLDIHNEAMRLKELKAKKSPSPSPKEEKEGPLLSPKETTCPCGGNTGECQCDPGKCACVGCGNKTGERRGELGGAAADIRDTARDIGVGAQEKGL